MIIPKEPGARKSFYDELVRQCLSSRQDRFTFYQNLRNYYLFGSATKDGAVYNKIGSTIDTLASFIYSPDSVRFSIFLGETADKEDIHKSIPLAREVTDQWRISSTHLRFALALRWSLVFGSMIMKVMWDRSAKSVRTYLVEPHQFGVLREDVLELSDQEAFCMCYTTTRSQLASMLRNDSRSASIMARVGDSNSGATHMYAEGLQRLILGGPVGGVPGSVATGNGGGGFVQGGLPGSGSVAYDYEPKIEADLIDMVDLYVYDDELEDYQLVSIAAPDVIIFDRPQSAVGIAKHPHFIVVQPEPNLYDYFWGDSFTARLTQLQDWRTERTGQIRGMMKKQFDPPMSATGMGGISDEKFAALRSPGGRLFNSSPGGKIETHYPQMPQDAFAELGQIDQMFDDVAGIGHILQGKGEHGVRSRGQADLMARLGSSRPKVRAIVAEEAAEDLATLILHNLQEYSEQRFIAHPPGQDSLPFIAQQFTVDYEVKVDAHSSSPIFVEDRKADAKELFEAKAIDRETLLDMFDPPNVQMLKERLKLIEQHESEQAKQKMEMEAQKGRGHG